MYKSTILRLGQIFLPCLKSILDNCIYLQILYEEKSERMSHFEKSDRVQQQLDYT